jgi:Bacterial protein of unknown function (DUF899)
MTSHRIGTREEWLAASAELLAREKELTRTGDELARQRRALPWVPVEKQYTLQAEEGARTLAELFDGRSQLVVYHFMFGPGYQGGCPACSSTADSFNSVLPSWGPAADSSAPIGRCRELRDVPAHRRIQVHLPVGDQVHHRRRGEGLGDRAHLVRSLAPVTSRCRTSSRPTASQREAPALRWSAPGPSVAR